MKHKPITGKTHSINKLPLRSQLAIIKSAREADLRGTEYEGGVRAVDNQHAHLLDLFGIPRKPK